MTALFTEAGALFLLRWLHFFFGIIWIGHLYYFNFTQMPFFAETDGATKSGAIQKLVPRALWWFRWGAMFTIVTGWLYIGIKAHSDGAGFLSGGYGLSILTGGIIGTIMFLNVWLIIWPSQKVVIASAVQVAGGGQAIAGAADRGARAGVASRTNTLFSIPMLFFMGSASHFSVPVTPESNTGLYWGLVALVIAIIEANAIKGKLGPLATVKGVITAGFTVSAVLYFIGWGVL